MSRDLLAAHMNSLNSTLHAVEAQVASVKLLLKMSAAPVEADEADEAEAEDETPAPVAKKKKVAAPVEAEEEEEEEAEEEAEEEEEDADEVGKKKVIRALQAYATENSKKEAVALLKKVTGKMSVHDVPPSLYAKLTKALA